jgi:large subunit ribosomal protein L25
MDKITFTAETREGKGKGPARQLRASGFIPGILYGAENEPCSIKVEKRNAENIIRKLESHNVMADLILKKDKGETETIKTMVKDIQIEPINMDVLHIDFYRIRMDQAVRMEVAIHLIGEAPGLEKGGILEQELREMEIQALPDKIPSVIEVDVSKLDIGDTVSVKDIILPEGVEAVDEGEKTIVTILAPKAVEEEAPAEEGAEAAAAATAEKPAEPEVISEKEAAERRKEKESSKTEQK